MRFRDRSVGLSCRQFICQFVVVALFVVVVSCWAFVPEGKTSNNLWNWRGGKRRKFAVAKPNHNDIGTKRG